MYLIFSVNQSGHFQGYARMVTPIHGNRSQWTNQVTYGGTFGIQWECLCDLPFSRTLHLHNPWNEGKPVKIARDGQEVQPEVGKQLVALLEARRRNNRGTAPHPRLLIMGFLRAGLGSRLTDGRPRRPGGTALRPQDTAKALGLPKPKRRPQGEDPAAFLAPPRDGRRGGTGGGGGGGAGGVRGEAISAADVREVERLIRGGAEEEYAPDDPYLRGPYPGGMMGGGYGGYGGAGRGGYPEGARGRRSAPLCAPRPPHVCPPHGWR